MKVCKHPKTEDVTRPGGPLGLPLALWCSKCGGLGLWEARTLVDASGKVLLDIDGYPRVEPAKYHWKLPGE